MDVQPQMLDRLRSRLEAALPITLVVGDAARTTLPDGCVDIVFFANVWHEVDDRPAALVEAARIVRPGGRIAILDWRTDAESPVGPPIPHRFRAGSVELGAVGWRVQGPAERVGPYECLVIAGVAA